MMSMMSMVMDLQFVALLDVDVHQLLQDFYPPYLDNPFHEERLPLVLVEPTIDLDIVDHATHHEWDKFYFARIALMSAIRFVHRIFCLSSEQEMLSIFYVHVRICR